MNTHRQVISAIYVYGMREDTYRLALNPAAATTKRREPPPAVLDFYETDEVEAIARAAEAGAHRDNTKLTYDDSELAARAREDRRDAELYRIAGYTGLRLGELLALRRAEVNLVDRRLVTSHPPAVGPTGALLAVLVASISVMFQPMLAIASGHAQEASSAGSETSN